MTYLASGYHTYRHTCSCWRRMRLDNYGTVRPGPLGGSYAHISAPVHICKGRCSHLQNACWMGKLRTYPRHLTNKNTRYVSTNWKGYERIGLGT